MWLITRDLTHDTLATKNDFTGMTELPETISRVGVCFDGETIQRAKTQDELNAFAWKFSKAVGDNEKAVCKVRLYDDDNHLYIEAVALSKNHVNELYEFVMSDMGDTYCMYEDFRGHWRYLLG